MEAPSAVWKAVRACTPRAQRFCTIMEAARSSRNARRGTAPRRRVCATASARHNAAARFRASRPRAARWTLVA